MSGSADIQWPSFQGQATLVGTSPSGRVTVYADPSLGEPGQQNATDLLAGADQAVQANDQFFGTSSGSVNVVVFALGGKTDGTGGADHLGCDYVAGKDIEVCAAFGNSRRVIALFEAELSECNMGGNLCGVSTGEALSRWCAAVVSDNALGDFATAPTWLDNGAPDYVSRTDPTDQDPVSIGCGMAFISWLLSQSLALSTIARAVVALGSEGTLAQLYASLTGNDADTAYLTFMGAVRGLIGGVTNDDPFGGLSSARRALVATRSHPHRLLPPGAPIS
jgi:hypothetical protein